MQSYTQLCISVCVCVAGEVTSLWQRSVLLIHREGLFWNETEEQILFYTTYYPSPLPQNTHLICYTCFSFSISHRGSLLVRTDLIFLIVPCLNTSYSSISCLKTHVKLIFTIKHFILDIQADFNILKHSVSEHILAVLWDSGLTTDGLVIVHTTFILMWKKTGTEVQSVQYVLLLWMCRSFSQHWKHVVSRMFRDTKLDG